MCFPLLVLFNALNSFNTWHGFAVVLVVVLAVVHFEMPLWVSENGGFTTCHTGTSFQVENIFCKLLYFCYLRIGWNFVKISN